MDLNNKINLDDGYFFGRGAFETILVLKEPVFLQLHLKRLNSSLKFLNIDKVITEKEVLEKIKELNIKNEALKIAVSKENVLFTKRKVPYTEENYKKGFDVKISNSKRNEYSSITYLKSLSYLENIIEKENAKKEGFQESIFLNTKNYLAEGSVSNLFFIKNKKIYTPQINCGILPGTIRGFLIDNIESIGYEIVEGDFTINQLLNCDGAFLTNSLMGIMKINSLNNKKIKESEITKEISKFYKKQITLSYDR